MNGFRSSGSKLLLFVRGLRRGGDAFGFGGGKGSPSPPLPPLPLFPEKSRRRKQNEKQNRKHRTLEGGANPNQRKQFLIWGEEVPLTQTSNEFRVWGGGGGYYPLLSSSHPSPPPSPQTQPPSPPPAPSPSKPVSTATWQGSDCSEYAPTLPDGD